MHIILKGVGTLSLIRGCVNGGFILAQLVARILVPLSMAGVRDRRFDFEAEKWNKWKMGLGMRRKSACFVYTAKFGIDTDAYPFVSEAMLFWKS